MKHIIEEILRPCDITPDYAGFPPLVAAVERYLEDPDRIYSVEAEIYAPAAARCGCKTEHVERNIRTILQHAWETNPGKLCQLTRCELLTYPKVSDFIEALALAADKALTPTG